MTIRKISLKLILILISYLLASFIIVAMLPNPILVDKRIGMITLSNFQGHRPFQYRVLMPLVIRGIEAITPDFIKDSVTVLAGPKIMANMENRDIDSDKANVISKYVFRSVLYICLQILMMFFFLLALRLLAGALEIFPQHLTDFVPLGMVLVMPIYYDSAIYVFDFPHLVLFTLGLYLLYKQNWTWYLIVLGLGILNKETAILLGVVFVLAYHSRLEKSQLIKLLILQAVIFLAIKFPLFMIFGNRPGGFVEWRLADNFEHLTKLSNYFRFTPIGRIMLLPIYLNIPLPRGTNLPLFIVIISAVWYRWKEKPVFLRKALGYLAVVIPLAFTMGLVFELRAYFDVLPIIYLLGTAGIYKFISKLKKSSAGIEYGR